VGVQLLANSLATVFGLAVLITLVGPVSGAHFNPAITLAAWFTGRRDGTGPNLREVLAHVLAAGRGMLECARRLQLALNTVKRYARADRPERMLRPKVPRQSGRSVP